MRLLTNPKRWALTVACAVSLVLSLAVGALWIRSHRVIDSWIGHLGNGHYKLVTMKGLIALHWEPGFAYRADYYGYHAESLRFGPVEGKRVDRASMFGRLDDKAMWAVIGFSFSRHTSCPPKDSCRRASAPLWFVTAIPLIMPLYVGMVAIRRRLRSAAGKCPGCGYDLRATPDRCPECGERTITNEVAQSANQDAAHPPPAGERLQSPP